MSAIWTARHSYQPHDIRDPVGLELDRELTRRGMNTADREGGGENAFLGRTREELHEKHGQLLLLRCGSCESSRIMMSVESSRTMSVKSLRAKSLRVMSVESLRVMSVALVQHK